MSLVPITILIVTVMLTVTLALLIRFGVGSNGGMSRRSLGSNGGTNSMTQEIMPQGKQIWARQDGAMATIYMDAATQTSMPISGYDKIPTGVMGKQIELERLKSYCQQSGIELNLFPRPPSPHQTTVVRSTEVQAQAAAQVKSAEAARDTAAEKENPASKSPAVSTLVPQHPAPTAAVLQKEIQVFKEELDIAADVRNEVIVMDKALDYMKLLFAKISVATSEPIKEGLKTEIETLGTFMIHLWPEMNEKLQELKKTETTERFSL